MLRRFNQCYWVTGSVLGSLLGAVLPFSTAGIEFSMTALSIASFTEQWLSTRDHIPALTGLLSTFVCLLLFGSERFLIPAMILMTMALSLLKGKELCQDAEIANFTLNTALQWYRIAQAQGTGREDSSAVIRVIRETERKQ